MIPNPQESLSVEVVYERLGLTPEHLREFCQRWQVVELAVFGSVLRQDFRQGGTDPSDVDFLYSFAETAQRSLFDVVRMREELEDLCQRKVDLISRAGIRASRNWLRRQEILNSARLLYVQR